MTDPAPRAGLTGVPANFIVAGRRCVVVGAGRVAARKIAPLLDAGADVVVVAPQASEKVRAWAREGRVEWHERPFEPSDLDGTWLAFTATGVSEVDAAVFDAAQDRRVWLNSADDPANCSFTLVSVVRRGDIVVTIGTNGRSPALAAYLKERFSAELGPEYEVLLGMLSEEREQMRAGGRSSEDADWQRALDFGILDLIRNGREAEARELLRSCL
ncbi:MAG TPA: bifunctional precorrin-2 dehydrogenase/sirohydrochlorin ferrochelatase [Acidimicrobiia bacterium]|jgi:siroheme synthase-like protein